MKRLHNSNSNSLLDRGAAHWSMWIPNGILFDTIYVYLVVACKMAIRLKFHVAVIPKLCQGKLRLA